MRRSRTASSTSTFRATRRRSPSTSCAVPAHSPSMPVSLRRQRAASADRMAVRAFAKINLSLQVLGVRRDGYHELRTTFQTIGLHDTLTIRKRRGPFVLRCNDAACPVDGTNLV